MIPRNPGIAKEIIPKNPGIAQKSGSNPEKVPKIMAHSCITTYANIGRSIIIQGNEKMGVNRWHPVQKATYFLKKPKVGKNEECTVTVKTATDQ